MQQDWKIGVAEEKQELDLKIEKLESFMKKAPGDLSEQLMAMKRYSYILERRLNDDITT